MGGGGGRDAGLAGGGGRGWGAPPTTWGAGPGRTGGGGGSSFAPAPCSALCELMAATWFFRPSPLCARSAVPAQGAVLSRIMCPPNPLQVGSMNNYFLTSQKLPVRLCSSEGASRQPKAAHQLKTAHPRKEAS